MSCAREIDGREALSVDSSGVVEGRGVATEALASLSLQSLREYLSNPAHSHLKKQRALVSAVVRECEVIAGQYSRCGQTSRAICSFESRSQCSSFHKRQAMQRKNNSGSWDYERSKASQSRKWALQSWRRRARHAGIRWGGRSSFSTLPHCRRLNAYKLPFLRRLYMLHRIRYAISNQTSIPLLLRPRPCAPPRPARTESQAGSQPIPACHHTLSKGLRPCSLVMTG